MTQIKVIDQLKHQSNEEHGINFVVAERVFAEKLQEALGIKVQDLQPLEKVLVAIAIDATLNGITHYLPEDEFSRDKVGIALRKIRDRHGIGIHNLADQVGISHTAIVNLEQGHTMPNLGTIIRFLSAFPGEQIMVSGTSIHLMRSAGE